MGKLGIDWYVKLFFFRFVTANEVLAQIEENDSVTSPKVFIQPLNDGMDSEGHTGDEQTGGPVNNLSGKQLQAAAEAKISSMFLSPQQGNPDDNPINFVVDSSIDNFQNPVDIKDF